MAVAHGLKPFVLPPSLRIVILDTPKLFEDALSALLEPLARSENRAVVVRSASTPSGTSIAPWAAQSPSLRLISRSSWKCLHHLGVFPPAFSVVLAALTLTTGPQAQGPHTCAPTVFHFRQCLQQRQGGAYSAPKAVVDPRWRRVLDDRPPQLRKRARASRPRRQGHSS